MGTQNLTLGGHQEIHTLQYIKEEFIATIFDPFTSPPNLSSHLAGDLGLLFLSLTLDALLSDEGLQSPCFRVLRIAKIQDFYKRVKDN